MADALPSIFRRNGMDAAAAVAQAGGEVLDAVCDMRQAGKIGMSAVNANAPDGPAPGRPNWPPPPAPGCTSPYYEKVVQAYVESCGKAPDCGYINAILETIGDTSFAEVENLLGTSSLNFVPTGAVGTGLANDGVTPTTFVANWPVGSGESILLQQEAGFVLPWLPGCADLDLTFTAGDMASNYAKIRVRYFVGPKTQVFNTTVNAPIGAFGTLWNRRKVYRGKEWICGDSCKEVPVIGISGCAGKDLVGKDSQLLIQIDNVGGTNDIEGGTVEIDFAGLVQPCCNSCQTGSGSCNCGH